MFRVISIRIAVTVLSTFAGCISGGGEMDSDAVEFAPYKYGDFEDIKVIDAAKISITQMLVNANEKPNWQFAWSLLKM